MNKIKCVYIFILLLMPYISYSMNDESTIVEAKAAEELSELNEDDCYCLDWWEKEAIVRFIKQEALNNDIEIINNLLIKAVNKNLLYVAQILLSAGADANTKYSGSPILTEAAYHGYEEIFGLLVGYGADVNEIDNVGKTSLFWASLKGHTRIVEIVLNNKDLNILDKNNFSALELASKHGFDEIVKLLVQNNVS